MKSPELNLVTPNGTKSNSTDATETTFVRLAPSREDFPLLWLQFTHRVKKLWAKCAPYMPAEGLLQDWHQKLFNAPELLPMWVILDESHHMVGHLVAGADIYFGQPFIAIHQLEVDCPHITKRHRREGMEAFLEWVTNLNRTLKEAESPVRFEAMRFLTPRIEKAWHRWIGLEPILVENVLTYALPSEVYEV